jgi:glutaredoxin 3
MASDQVLIFGQDLCPYTSRAREDYSRRRIPFDYINVLNDPDGLKRMLEYSKNRREIPVIVENGKVTIGFGGT